MLAYTTTDALCKHTLQVIAAATYFFEVVPEPDKRQAALRSARARNARGFDLRAKQLHEPGSGIFCSQGVKSKGKKLLKMHNALHSAGLFCSR